VKQLFSGYVKSSYVFTTIYSFQLRKVLSNCTENAVSTYRFMFRYRNKPNAMKKALRLTRTLRAGCSKAEPKIFAPPQTPFPGAQDGQNLISWRWSLLYLQTQFGEDRCTQFRVIVVTDTACPPASPLHTHRQDRLQHTAPQLASAQCN